MSDLNKKIERIYSNAVFEFALENDQVEHWNQVLIFFVKLLEQEQIKKILDARLLSPHRLEDFFLSCYKNQFNNFSQNFIKMIIKNSRLMNLPGILKNFLYLKNEYKKRKDAYVLSAVKLSKKQCKIIIDKLEKRFGYKVNLHCAINQNLICGITIRVGDTLIDGSAMGYLNCLRNLLKTNY
ncbi:ATP synthase subunit delta [Candidatus Photodesmus katoptron]|uniref:ATP synthase F1 subunit delta n=1 Tax=Candidatus Photodesmus anomalopis TaxID=28176 RepID=UPI0004D4A65A|nr:ATP synthase F1 subunit delta [Candidatus Photodesmus katoptron]KEY90197.1 ATP synthase subunit delta [Candidatus Photodesmus katoptron]